MADATEESSAYFAALWVCHKRKQTAELALNKTVQLQPATRCLPGTLADSCQCSTADTTSNADDVSDTLLSSLLDLDLSYSQSSRCRTPSVTARVRATCSSGASRVRTFDPTLRPFRLKNVSAEHGPIKLSTYLTNYRIGDIVDIKANAAQQKGMPHKYYHG